VDIETTDFSRCRHEIAAGTAADLPGHGRRRIQVMALTTPWRG